MNEFTQYFTHWLILAEIVHHTNHLQQYVGILEVIFILFCSIVPHLLIEFCINDLSHIRCLFVITAYTYMYVSPSHAI